MIRFASIFDCGLRIADCGFGFHNPSVNREPLIIEQPRQRQSENRNPQSAE
jgi:hypothetical protein